MGKPKGGFTTKDTKGFGNGGWLARFAAAVPIASAERLSGGANHPQPTRTLWEESPPGDLTASWGAAPLMMKSRKL